jgi:hypothetical protein
VTRLKELFDLDAELKDLRKKVKDKEIERESLLAGILSKDITKEDNLVLTPNTKNVRVPVIQKFRDLLGDKFDSVIKIQIGKAEEILTKEVVTSACTFEQHITYSVIDEGKYDNEKI